MEVAEQGGLGCLSCIPSMFVCVGVDSSIPHAKCVTEAGPQVLYSLLCATIFSAGLKILWSNKKTLTLKLSMAASKTTVGSTSLDGVEDRQKTGVLCMRVPGATQCRRVQFPSTLLHIEPTPQSLLFEIAMVSKDQCAPYICEQLIRHMVPLCLEPGAP